MRTLRCFLAAIFFVYPSLSTAWNNGQQGNASTDDPSECDDPPYATHDWIADRALALVPNSEKEWLLPHKTLYLLGTEAPDNNEIPDQCGAPNNGYDDRRKGHSVEWAEDWSDMVDGRAADRAQEEYEKAVAAYKSGNHSAAAFYMGAMAHYIGDVSQYGHSVPFEKHHSDYEGWVAARTKSFDDGPFAEYIKLDKLVQRKPYAAVKRISKITAGGKNKILWPTKMEQLYKEKENSQEYIDSIGYSLNLGINELADVLHTFYLKVVNE